MSKLIFNGQTHQISLVGDDGIRKGVWVAYNNVDRHASLTHVRNGRYGVLDRLCRIATCPARMAHMDSTESSASTCKAIPVSACTPDGQTHV
jgi:hypothetical protein